MWTSSPCDHSWLRVGLQGLWGFCVWVSGLGSRGFRVYGWSLRSPLEGRGRPRTLGNVVQNQQHLACRALPAFSLDSTGSILGELKVTASRVGWFCWEPKTVKLKHTKNCEPRIRDTIYIYIYVCMYRVTHTHTYYLCIDLYVYMYYVCICIHIICMYTYWHTQKKSESCNPSPRKWEGTKKGNGASESERENNRDRVREKEKKSN